MKSRLFEIIITNDWIYSSWFVRCLLACWRWFRFEFEFQSSLSISLSLSLFPLNEWVSRDSMNNQTNSGPSFLSLHPEFFFSFSTLPTLPRDVNAPGKQVACFYAPSCVFFVPLGLAVRNPHQGSKILHFHFKRKVDSMIDQFYFHYTRFYMK